MEVVLDAKLLDRLVLAFKGNIPVARIGVLGKKDSRKEGTKTNSEIGAIHEYGLPVKNGKSIVKMPERSFLRMPLTDHLQEFLEKSGAFDQAAIKQVIKEGSIKTYVRKIAAVAETVIAEAFSSGGFGKWKPSNMAYKKVQLTLVETQQLRNSISSEVK